MSSQLSLHGMSFTGTSEPAVRPSRVRRVDLDAIMAGDRELIIEHRGEDYRLRVTSNGKLLLTK